MRATNLAIGLVCLIASVTLINAALGPVLGIDLVTGSERDINETNENLSKEIDSKSTNDGELSPIGALRTLVQMINHLSNADTILYNLGLPGPIARWATAPLVFIMAIAMVAIVLRTRL